MRRQPSRSLQLPITGHSNHCHASQGSEMTQPCSGDLASFLQETRSGVLIDGDLAPHPSSASASTVRRENKNSVEMSLPACDGLESHSQWRAGPQPRPQELIGRLSTHWLLIRPETNETVPGPPPSMPCLCLLGPYIHLAIHTSSSVFCLWGPVRELGSLN